MKWFYLIAIENTCYSGSPVCFLDSNFILYQLSLKNQSEKKSTVKSQLQANPPNGLHQVGGSSNIMLIIDSFLPQVASWGGDLLDRGILTVSLAPRDNHEAQVQFALERGIPAVLGIISTQRLPFPSNSFDIAHCSRCLIPWAEFGNAVLL